MKRLSACAICLVLAPIAIGCQQSSSPHDGADVVAARDRYVMDDEPAGVEGVLDVQETYSAPRDVVLVGKIGGVENPWTSGKAAFVLADPIALAEKESTGARHACDDPGCKFCARKKADKLKEGLAVVEFKDEHGQVVPIDARQLFNVDESQMVVIRGRAHINELGCLVVAADGLYVRQ